MISDARWKSIALSTVLLVGLAPAYSQSSQHMVTFPDMVKKTSIQDAESSEAPELEEALAALEQDEADFSIASHRHPRFFAASFKTNTHPRSQYQVKIPESGNFKLVLEEADRFKIVDKDATDGEAKIQMPASTLKTFLYLKGKRRNRATLEIEDPLYHVKDTISTARRWGKWLTFGLRPLPVPTDWQSEDGNQLVFKMNAQNVKHFVMIWLRSNKTAAFPPGLAEIGPEGGIIELPGVATVTFGESDITEPTVFSIKQLKKFPSVQQLGLRYGSYIGPIIHISPEKRIEISKISRNGIFTTVNIELDKEKLKNQSLSSLDYGVIPNYLGPESEYNPSNLSSLTILLGENEDISFETKFLLEQTGAIFPLYTSFMPISARQENGFGIQQVQLNENKLCTDQDVDECLTSITFTG